MRNNRFNTATLLLLMTATLSAPLAFAESDDNGEFHERNVDEAAISSQDEAVQNLVSLLAKYRNTPKESLFLYKLATIQQQSASMKFRVAHGNSHKNQSALDLSGYKSQMRQSVATLDELIAKFPTYPEIATAHFMRGKAFEEIGDKTAATRNYLHLTSRFPSAPETIPAYMSLAQFSIDAEKHSAALAYLRNVEKLTQDSHYPQALYKMAWSHYSLRQFQAALTYAERLVTFYNNRLKSIEDPKVAASEKALRETVLMDAVVFFHDGTQAGAQGHGLTDALTYFRKLSTEEELGKMTVRFAKLLRTRDSREQLQGWKALLLTHEPKRPETMDVLITAYEYQMNRQLFADITTSAADLAGHFKRMTDEQKTQTQKLLLDTTTTLQSLMVQYKESNRVPVLAAQIAAVYKAFTEIVDEDDRRLRTIHANLAETLFSIKQYNESATHYRWIVEHGSWSESGGITVPEASLKSIAARYEALRFAKLVPGELKAVALPKSDPSKAHAQVTEWIQWIDEHQDEAGLSGLDNFHFEANRVLYGMGYVNQATERLKKFSLKHPASPFAIPAATLVFDTAIATARWEQVVELADEYIDVKEWAGTPFSKRAYATAADAQFKHVESLANTRNYDDAVEQTDVLLKKYGSSERVTDGLAVAGNSALSMNRRDLAIKYYGQLASKRNSPEAAKALLTVAKIEEDRYAFSEAAKHYESYLSLPRGLTQLNDKAARDMRKRIFNLSWLGGAIHKNHCSEFRSECERYQSLATLKSSSKPSAKSALRTALSAPSHIQAVWAAIALENSSQLSGAERQKAIQILASSWSKLDGEGRLATLSRINESVPAIFAGERKRIQNSGPLKAEERSITRRIQLITAMEDAAATAAKLPWAGIRSRVLNEVAAAYEDLASGLKQLPPPKGLSERDQGAYSQMVAKLTRPFEQKARAVRTKSIQLAGFASSDRNKLEVSDLGWSRANPDTATRGEIFKTRFAKALDSGNWPQVAHFLLEAEKTQFISRNELETAKLVSVSVALGKEGS